MPRRPLRAAQVNCGSSNGWSEQRSLGILHRTLEVTKPDVVFVCEIANATTDHLGLDPQVWDVLHDPSSRAKGGSALCVRKSRATVGWHALRVGSPAGAGIRTRYIWVARLSVDVGSANPYILKVVSGHAPPKRAWVLSPTWFASVRSRDADVVGADFNRLSGYVGRALSRRTSMAGIVGFAHRRFPVSGVSRHDVGSDHPACVVTFWPVV